MKKKKIYINWIMLVFLLLGFSMGIKAGEQYRKVKDLSGEWRFSIGDKSEWANPDFDDSDWEMIKVPGRWENEGYYGYDGYAWYRNSFTLSQKTNKMPVYLSLGYIDDVDEVFFNGKLIGKTGSFPTYYSTAFNAKRFYRIPNELINGNGKNTIAVRVFDEGGEGGIIHGDIAIIADLNAIPVDFDLQGEWNFKLGDKEVVSNDVWEFSNWDKILVPDMWENQGYKNYDGVGTYAVEFDVNNEFQNRQMVLVLGKIDDIEQVYLNGELVSQFGNFDRKTTYKYSEAYRQLRGVYLPEDVLIHNGRNVLVVKVLDTGGIGGIYEGTVGLITQDNYIEYWNNRRRN